MFICYSIKLGGCWIYVGCERFLCFNNSHVTILFVCSTEVLNMLFTILTVAYALIPVPSQQRAAAPCTATSPPRRSVSDAPPRWFAFVVVPVTEQIICPGFCIDKKNGRDMYVADNIYLTKEANRNHGNSGYYPRPMLRHKFNFLHKW
jgi:hypothetical protein